MTTQQFAGAVSVIRTMPRNKKNPFVVCLYKQQLIAYSFEQKAVYVRKLQPFHGIEIFDNNPIEVPYNCFMYAVRHSRKDEAVEASVCSPNINLKIGAYTIKCNENTDNAVIAVAQSVPYAEMQNVGILHEKFKACLPFLSKDELRPWMMDIICQPKRYFATDAYILIVQNYQLSKVQKQLQDTFRMPAWVAVWAHDRMIHVSKNTTGGVILIESQDDKILYSYQHDTISNINILIDKTFYTNYIQVERKRMLSFMQKAKTVPLKNRVVKMELHDTTGIQLIAGFQPYDDILLSDLIPFFKTDISADNKVAVGVNPRLMFDALKEAQGDVVTIQFHSQKPQSAPIWINSVILVMPTMLMN